MNAPNSRGESSALALPSQAQYEVGHVTNAAALILGPAFERVETFAALMAKGSVSVPKHLRGNMGDCMAITIQALGWRMNPFAVAQKTHLSQSGALGYEAQLVSAILVSTGAVKTEPDYEAIGDWSKVLGKVEERQGKARQDGTEGGKYFVATYTKKDEEGLGVVVRATLAGESRPRELKVMMSQAYPRFSTQWATDPYQQLCYLAVRKWGRLHSPGAILGVYTSDELDGGEQAPEKFMGPADVVGAPAAGAAAATAEQSYPHADFEANFPAWSKVIEGGKKTAAQIIAMVNASAKGALTEPQKAKLLSVKSKAADATPKPPAGDPFTAPTYAEVAGKLTAAKTQDELNLAGDLIKAVADETHRTELQALFDKRQAELTSKE